MYVVTARRACVACLACGFQVFCHAYGFWLYGRLSGCIIEHVRLSDLEVARDEKKKKGWRRKRRLIRGKRMGMWRRRRRKNTSRRKKEIDGSKF